MNVKGKEGKRTCINCKRLWQPVRTGLAEMHKAPEERALAGWDGMAQTMSFFPDIDRKQWPSRQMHALMGGY